MGTAPFDIFPTEEEWKAHFEEPLRTGRVPGETLDFFILCPLAEKEKEEAWKQSKMQDIVKYIRDQIPDLSSRKEDPGSGK